MRILWKLLCILAVSLLLTACSSELTPPPPLVFDVTANSRANNGGLFYFVVRSSNEKQFMLESYQDIAGTVFSDPPDPKQLGVFSIVPGTSQEITVDKPAQGTIALYFLLTTPGSQWKKLLSMPLANDYSITLTSTSQVNVEGDTSWFWSWF